MLVFLYLRPERRQLLEPLELEAVAAVELVVTTPGAATQSPPRQLHEREPLGTRGCRQGAQHLA